MSAMLATGCAASGDPEQAKPFFAGMPNPFIEVSDLRSAADRDCIVFAISQN